MPHWWNRQTWRTQTSLSKGVGVQVPHGAPNRQTGSHDISLGKSHCLTRHAHLATTLCGDIITVL